MDTDGTGATIIGWEDKMNTDAAARRGGVTGRRGDAMRRLGRRSHGWTRIRTDGLGVTVVGWEGKMNTDAAPRRAAVQGDGAKQGDGWEDGATDGHEFARMG
jgi:hypothetical protein